MFGVDLGSYNASDVLWLGDWSAGWIFALAMLGVAILALSIYDLRPLKPARRWTLVGLRGLVYALAVLLLLEPAVDLKNVTKVKNHVPILVDVSRSMTLRAGDDETPRFDQAKDALDKLDLPLEGADEDHEYTVFTFGESLATSSVEGVKKAEARAEDSNLTDALEAVKREFARAELGGVVVISDGTDSGGFGSRVRHGESLDEETIAAIKDFGAPINTVTTGNPDELRDVAIRHIMRDDFAFVHNKVSIDVEIQAVGFEGTSLPVSLEREGKLLQTRDLALQPGKTTYSVKFEFVPEHIGREIYTVAVPVNDGEVLAENNVVHFVQKVIRDKIRVLQVVGRPSWDERFLRRLLKRNPNIDLISFFILRTAKDPQVAPTSELSLIPFPTDELFSRELGSFDLVVFQNFDFGPYSMRQYLPEIADFVRGGGGFVMIGGDLSFASGGYAGTPIEDILPVELPSSRSSSLVDLSEFRPVLTEAGERHPITLLAFDPSANREIWENLPPQKGTNLVLQARENATVLATHPRLRANGKPMPVITVSEMEKGRVMAMTTDSTWRWGIESLADGNTPREYQMFWNSTMRWLIQDPELKLLRIEMPRDEVAPGDLFEAAIRVSNPDYTPAEGVKGEVIVTHRAFEHAGDPSKADVVHRGVFETDASGNGKLAIQLDEPGIYGIAAEAETGAGRLADDDVFVAVTSIREYRDVLPRPELMQALSDASEGTAGGPDDRAIGEMNLLPPRTVQVNRRTVIHLWDSFPIFLIILTLLGTEWTLRRRWGRL